MPEEEKNLAASRQILCFPFLPHFSGAAQIPPAGKIPFVGKIPALAGFNGINPAAVFRQHHAGSVFRVPDRQSAPVGSQPAACVNKNLFVHVQETGNLVDFIRLNAHIPGPAAARAASGAFIPHRFSAVFHTHLSENSPDDAYVHMGVPPSRAIDGMFKILRQFPDGAGHLLQPRQNLPDSGTCDERRLIGPLENLAVNNIAFINLGNVLGKAKMRVLLHINATAYRTLGAERVKEAPDAFNPVRRFRQTFRMHPHGG
jgi:hypothetical protein